MQGRTKPLSLLSATTLGCTLALGAPLALPQVGTFTAAQAQENQAQENQTGTQAGTESRTYVNYEGDYVIAGVHTEMLNAFLDGDRFTLGALADTAPGQQGRFNPAHTVFHLPDVEDAHTTVAAGYDYIAPEGTDIFYIPSTRTRGLLYPGLGAEGIRPGALKDNTINLELVRSSVPEGGRAEVFTESGRDNPRVFSTNDKLAPHTITAGGHEHLSWAFTRAGIYQLTFRATATLTDGTPVSSEATYTIAVGTNAEDGFKLLNAQNAAQEATKGATSEATSTATESATNSASASTSASAEAGASAEASASTGIRRVDASVNGQNAAQVTDPNGAKAAANGEQAGQGGSSVTAISGADNINNGSDKGESKGGNSPSMKGSSVKGSNAQNVTAPGNNSGGGILSSGLPGSLNQQCIATEVPAEDAKDSKDAQKDSKQNAQAAQAPTGIPTLAVVNTAEHSGREEVTHGHFDVGPVLNGGTLTSSVKDDRTSPARHVSPGALEFVLNDAAKLNLPAGMEDIAPAGTPVYMIGATQQQGVPWLGWSTQDPELLKQLDGPVTMSLNGFEGPGTLSTFLSGNFGSAGQKVFDSRSGGSFQVPANTHQHSNWVFTAEGRYTVTIGWTARLKNGQQVSSESVLHFTVGNPDNAPASNNAQGAAGTKQDGGEKSTAKNPLNGTVDEATGIVTKPDGSKVRIVGKTASGEDCALTSQELANAQKAAAAGKLPNTGVVIDPFMVSTSILALALGAMALRSARRKGRSGDAA